MTLPFDRHVQRQHVTTVDLDRFSCLVQFFGLLPVDDMQEVGVLPSSRPERRTPAFDTADDQRSEQNELVNDQPCDLAFARVRQVPAVGRPRR